MIPYVKKLFNQSIIKIFSQNALVSLTKLVSGFVTVKVVANIIGPPGVALVGQLNNLSSMFQVASTGGINNGITKYIAQNAGSQEKINIYLKTGTWIVFAFSAVCSLVLILGSGYFATTVLKDIKYRSIFVCFGLTIILYAVNNILLNVITGYKLYKSFVKVGMIGGLISLVFSVFLAYFYNVYGALLAVVTYQSVVVFATLGVLWKSDWFIKKNFFGRADKKALIGLSRYSLMAVVNMISAPFSQLMIRNHIVTAYSLHDAGIWEGVNRVSVMYLTIVNTSMSVYYLPRLSEIKSRPELRSEIASVYRFIVPFMLFCITGIFIFRKLIIAIAFSKAFGAMESLFFYQLIGDFFKVCASVLSFQMLAKSMTSTYIFTEVFSAVVIVGIAWIFIDRYGPVGGCMGYAGNSFLYFLLMLVIFRDTVRPQQRCLAS